MGKKEEEEEEQARPKEKPTLLNKIKSETLYQIT